jgi:hypothetical protein
MSLNIPFTSFGITGNKLLSYNFCNSLKFKFCLKIGCSFENRSINIQPNDQMSCEISSTKNSRASGGIYLYLTISIVS